MSTRVATILGVTIMFSLLLISPSSADTRSAANSITSRVTDPDGKPIEGVVIYLLRGVKRVAAQTSDEHGMVYFRGFPPDEYEVEARAVNFDASALIGEVAPYHPLISDVGGRKVKYVPFDLEPELTLHGVLGPSGRVDTQHPKTADTVRFLLNPVTNSTRVYYVTDRLPTADDPTKFTNVWDSTSPLRYGYCDVEVVEPFRTSCNAMSDIESTSLALTTALNSVDAKQLIVFSHGFSVDHIDAMRASAVISRACGRPVIAYDWASAKDGSLGGYVSDEERIDGSLTIHGRGFVEQLLRRIGPEHLLFIGHSMGARATLQFLMLADDSLVNPSLRPLPTGAFFAGDEYRSTFLGSLTSLSSVTGLIMNVESTRDVALLASLALHDGNPRIGSELPNVFTATGVVTIDASRADSDFFGHGYVTDPKLLNSLSGLFDHKNPASVGLAGNTNPTYWRY